VIVLKYFETTGGSANKLFSSLCPSKKFYWPTAFASSLSFTAITLFNNFLPYRFLMGNLSHFVLLEMLD